MEYLEKEISKNATPENSVEDGMTPVETWKFMCKSEQARNWSRNIVFDWHKRFRDRRDSVQDEKKIW